MGLGSDHVYEVACDQLGCMIPEALESRVLEALAAGKRPFFVNATAGTTVLGAFDPFPAIADVCAKYNLWLHVDVSSTVYKLTFTCIQGTTGITTLLGKLITNKPSKIGNLYFYYLI